MENVQNSYSDCRIDDMMFVEGQSTGHIGLECVNETSYDGLETICGPDGALIEIEKQFTCINTVPTCVQCGERGFGAALCLFSKDAVQDDGCEVISSVPTPPDGLSELSCDVEEDCPIPDDPYCGYHCIDATCAMYCEGESPPEYPILDLQCVVEADCPTSDDPYCGYDCFNGTCAMWCVSENPPTLIPEEDDLSELSCDVDEDCPIPDDPYCGYHCLDGTCAMYCEGESPPEQLLDLQCVVEADCPTADDPYCEYDCHNGTCAMHCNLEPPTGCLVGDIMYIPGQSIGEIGVECINSTSYDAIQSKCVADGTISDSEGVSTCPSIVPYCVQCGPRGIGAALCLSTNTTDRDCGEVVEQLSTTEMNSVKQVDENAGWRIDNYLNRFLLSALIISAFLL